MTDVMLDLETWGLTPGCAVRSVGAVVFDRGSDKLGETFYRNISTKSCLYAGLRLEQGTAEWWEKPEMAEAAEKLKADQLPLLQVVTEFNAWLRKVGAEQLWAQGANYDPGIWEAASKAVAQPVGWKFFLVRDTRTVYDLFGFDPRSLKREGTYHGALDDAVHQARCVQAALANPPYRG